ncbi:hypothetical protein L4C33_08320 [Vibrio makurazakiensis]|uniref:hypothetical protein n=1 Tax=Vibrio makurazakiensis TaxID=2910250 RepID=UPI003D101B1F
MSFRVLAFSCLILFSQFSYASEGESNTEAKSMNIHMDKMEDKIDEYIKYNEEIEKIKSEKARLREYLSLVKLKISVVEEERKLKESRNPKKKVVERPKPVKKVTVAKPKKKKNLINDVEVLSFVSSGKRVNGVLLVNGQQFAMTKPRFKSGKYSFEFSQSDKTIKVSTSDDSEVVYLD